MRLHANTQQQPTNKMRQPSVHTKIYVFVQSHIRIKNDNRNPKRKDGGIIRAYVHMVNQVIGLWENSVPHPSCRKVIMVTPTSQVSWKQGRSHSFWSLSYSLSFPLLFLEKFGVPRQPCNNMFQANSQFQAGFKCCGCCMWTNLRPHAEVNGHTILPLKFCH